MITYDSEFDDELSLNEEEALFLNAGTRPTPQEWGEINRYVASL